MIIVECNNKDCVNLQAPIEVEEGPQVICGPCGNTLAEQDPDYVVEAPVSKVDMVKEMLSTLTEEEWQELRNVH